MKPGWTIVQLTFQEKEPRALANSLVITIGIDALVLKVEPEITKTLHTASKVNGQLAMLRLRAVTQALAAKLWFAHLIFPKKETTALAR